MRARSANTKRLGSHCSVPDHLKSNTSPSISSSRHQNGRNTVRCHAKLRETPSSTSGPSLLTENITVALQHPSNVGNFHRTTLLRRLPRQVRQQAATNLHQGHREQPEHRQRYSSTCLSNETPTDMTNSHQRHHHPCRRCAAKWLREHRAVCCCCCHW